MRFEPAPPASRLARRDFAGEQDRNRRRLRVVLAVYFAFAVLAGQWAGRAIEDSADPQAAFDRLTGELPAGPWWGRYPNQLAGALLLVSIVRWRRMERRGDALLLRLLDVEPLADRRARNVCEEMAIAAGVPVPRLWLARSDAANAFAWGTRPEATSIVLTRGLLERLDRDELQAVVAHEMGHVRNGDTRLTTMLLGLSGTFGLVAALALGPLKTILWDGWRAARETEAFDDGSDDGTTVGAVRERAVWESGDRERLHAEAEAGLAASPPPTGFLASWWEHAPPWQKVAFTVIFPVVAAVAVMALTALSALVFLGFGWVLSFLPWIVLAFAAGELWVTRAAPSAPVSPATSASPAVTSAPVAPATEAWPGQRMQAVAFFMPVGLIVGPAILVLGVLVPLGFVLLRLAVSRNREFDADAAAVEFTRNPEALLSALRRLTLESRPALDLARSLDPITIVPLRRRGDGERVPATRAWAGAVEALGAGRPGLARALAGTATLFDHLVGLLQSHPPLAERARRIEAMLAAPPEAPAPAPVGDR